MTSNDQESIILSEELYSLESTLSYQTIINENFIEESTISLDFESSRSSTEIFQDHLQILVSSEDNFSTDSLKLAKKNVGSLSKNLQQSLHHYSYNEKECPLCEDDLQYLSSDMLQAHLSMEHVIQCVQWPGLFLITCKLQSCSSTKIKIIEKSNVTNESYSISSNCLTNTSSGYPHFHCPFCKTLSYEQTTFERHLSMHEEFVLGKRKSKKYTKNDNLSKNHKTNFFRRRNHPSITQNIQLFVSELKLPNCKLCKENRRYTRHKSLLLHFNMFHFQKSIRIGAFTVLCCRLCCDRATRCHYHCPACSFSSPRVRIIQAHTKEHHPGLLHQTAPVPQDNSNQVLKRINENLQNKIISDACINGSEKKCKINALCELDSNVTKSNCIPVTKIDSKQYNETVLSNRNMQNIDFKVKPINNTFEDQMENKSVKIKIEEPVGSKYLYDAAPDTVIKLEPAEQCDAMSAMYCDVVLGHEISNLVKMELNDDSSADQVAVRELIYDTFEPLSTSKAALYQPASLELAYSQLSTPHCHLCSHQQETYHNIVDLEVHFYRQHVRHSISEFPECLALVCQLECFRDHNRYASDRKYLNNDSYKNNRHFRNNEQVEEDELLLQSNSTDTNSDQRHVHCPECRLISRDRQVILRHYTDSHSPIELPQDNSAYIDEKDIRKIDMNCPPLLRELLMLEADADPSFLAPSFPPGPRMSVMTDGMWVYRRLRPLHCVLCDDGREYRSHRLLLVHFERSHVKRANRSCPIPSLMCRLSCRSFGRGHYHCPFCLYVMHDLTKLRVHQYKLHRAVMRKAQDDIDSGRTIVLRAGRDDQDGGNGRAQTQRLEEVEEFKTCEGGFVKGKKKLPAPAVFTRAASVVTSLADVLPTLQLPDCPLCRNTRDFFTHKRLLSHFESTHVKCALSCAPYTVLSCRLFSSKYHDRGHYHCPLCLFMTHDKNILAGHYRNHSKKDEVSRLMEDAQELAEAQNPDLLGQYKVVLDHCSPQEKEKVEQWQSQFSAYLKHDFSLTIKRNSCVMAHERRKQIINHLLFGAKLEQHLMRYVLFKNYDVLSVPELGLKNCLVEPVVNYEAAVEESSDGSAACQLYERYRRVACVEEFFKVLYELHLEGGVGAHRNLLQMYSAIRSRFVFLPRAVVPHFLELCPACCAAPAKPGHSSTTQHAPPGGGRHAARPLHGHRQRSEGEALFLDHVVNRASHQPSGVGRLTQDTKQTSRFMATLQVNLIDMSDHPDGCHHYIVHCQDRHTQLHFLFPLQRLEMRLIAVGVIRHVIATCGLPDTIVSNSGHEFVHSLVHQIAAMWSEPCESLIRDHDGATVTLAALDSGDVIKELTTRMLHNKTESPQWTRYLGHMQYTLNTRAPAQDLSPFQLAFHRSPRPPELVPLEKAAATMGTSID